MIMQRHLTINFKQSTAMLLLFLFALGVFSTPVLAKEKEAPNPAIQANISNEQWEEAAFLEKKGIAALSFPDKDWWTAFQDPYLNEYILQALANNPSINAARIRIEEAQAQMKEQGANLWPSLSLGPSFNRIQLPDSGGGGLSLPSPLTLYQVPLQAKYELDLFGKNLNRYQSVKKSTSAVSEDTRAMEISLASQVASAYFNLLRADASLQSQQESLALFKRIDELKLNQHELGLIPLDEVIRADRDVAKAQTDLTTYQKEQALFAHQLSLLTGIPAQSAEHIQRASLSKIIPPDVVQAGVPSELVTRRPDILAQENRLQKAGIDVKVARKAFLPTINLSAALTLFSTDAGKLFNLNSLMNMQGVSLAQPLFRGGALKAQLTFRKARYREEIENYRELVLTAFKDVEDSLTQLKTGYQNQDNNTERLTLTQKNVRLQNSLYQQGIIPKLNLLQSQAELTQYQQMADQSKADVLIATISLYKALGGGY